MSRRLFVVILSGLTLHALAGPARAERLTFHVQPEASKVTFQTSAVERIIGGTSELEGEIRLDPDHPNANAAGTIVISAKALKSDNRRRDEHMHANALESESYPRITISTDEVRTEAEHLADGEQATFTVTGTLDLHGQRRQLTFPAQIQRQGNTVIVDGETSLLMTDYGITPPSLLFLKVRDLTEVGFHVVASAG